MALISPLDSSWIWALGQRPISPSIHFGAVLA